MSIALGIIAFLVMLNVIVIVHEAGHFMAARSFGVHCHEFSIGMGPVLYQKQGKETLFSIRAFPVGGYVMMAGEEDGSQSEDEEDSWLAKVPAGQRLNNKPKWQQVIVMAAGVFMNMVLALVLFISLAAARGYVVEDALPVVEQVTENSPAQAAGLQPGDTIVKVTASDGSVLEPETLYEITEFIQYNPGASVFTIERDGSTLDVEMTPVKDEETQTYLLGVTASANVRQIGFWESFKVGWDTMADAVASIFRSLSMLFQAKGLDSLSGPIGIYKVTDQVVSYGWMAYLSLFALISLNIGIFNLLPIPALDGGRILILALESVFRKKIPAKVVEGIIVASFMLLIGILVFATYNDITRYFF